MILKNISLVSHVENKKLFVDNKIIDIKNYLL